MFVRAKPSKDNNDNERTTENSKVFLCFFLHHSKKENRPSSVVLRDGASFSQDWKFIFALLEHPGIRT
jgi:hypothetical protein